MSFANLWDQSKGVENRELPDGEYIVKVEAVTSGTTKQTNLPKIEWKAEILSGPAKGKLFITRAMDSNKPFTIDRAKQDFLTLGLTPTSSDMQSVMSSLTGKTIKVKLETKNNFQNKDIIGFDSPVVDAEVVSPVAGKGPF